MHKGDVLNINRLMKFYQFEKKIHIHFQVDSCHHNEHLYTVNREIDKNVYEKLFHVGKNYFGFEIGWENKNERRNQFFSIKQRKRALYHFGFNFLILLLRRKLFDVEKLKLSNFKNKNIYFFKFVRWENHTQCYTVQFLHYSVKIFFFLFIGSKSIKFRDVFSCAK